MVQPQPHSGSALQLEMNGEELPVGTGSNGSLGPSSQSSLRVPPELASNEVVQRLVVDNQQLREALRRSNDSLRERCGEMEGWQKRAKEEREFLSCRFREAKSLVERLAQENQALLGKINHSATLPAIPLSSRNKSTLKENGNQASETEAKHPPPVGNGFQETPQMSTVHFDADAEDVDKLRSLPCEGSNEFLQLLKTHKEKLEEGMRDLRKRNELLEKENGEVEREKEELRNTVEQLRVRLNQLNLQGGAMIVEEVQRSEASHVVSESGSQLSKVNEQLQATQERYKDLQKQLDSLQKNSAHRDRTEAQLKQKEKDFAQLAKDSEAQRAQVTSLLAELHDRQMCLEKSEDRRRDLEEKLSVKTETLQALERDIEQQRKQHSITVDKLLLQVQNLETALKNDRLVITEERRKLAQLQHAYTCLFKDYDAKLKAENPARSGEVGDLSNRLVEAEKALALKQELIDKLKEDMEQQRSSLETIPVLTAQAEIYKADFQAERSAREQLHQRKEELEEELKRARVDIDRLKQEGSSRASLADIMRRHQHHPPATLQPPQSFHSAAEDQPDFRCPKCRYQAPDMDTLQIHVMDCIQ